MKKQQILVRSAGCLVRLRSDDESVIDAIRDSDFLSRYVPDCSVLGDEITDEQVPTIVIAKGAQSFEMNYPTARYRNEDFDEKDIVSLLEIMLERSRQEAGVYCLHSSSAVVNGEGVVFWGGASGMGKTTMSLLFGETDGCKTYSDEKTLINAGTMEMIGGVRTAYLTKGEVSKKYGLGFRKIDDGEEVIRVPLKILVQPQTVPGAKLFIEEWNNDKTEWHMYEELTRKIRGTSRRLFCGTLPVQSIDTDEVARKRSADSHRISFSVKSYFMRGDADEIKKAILEMLI